MLVRIEKDEYFSSWILIEWSELNNDKSSDTWTSNMWRKKEIVDICDALGEERIDDVNGLLRSEKLIYKSWIDKYFKGNSLILHFVLNLKRNM